MAMTAKTRQDVEGMSKEDRIWDRLTQTYDQKTEQSNQAYDKALAQTDRSLLKRGMQRSSYGAQTLAGLRNDKVKAANDIESEKIAMYEDKLGQLEEQEAARQFQTSEREAQQAWQSGENALNRAFQTSEREAQQTYNTGEREAQQTWQSGENALTRAFTTSEREAQQTWQSGENALNRAQDQAQFEANLGFQKEQFAETKAQNAWNRTFQESESAREQSNTDRAYELQREQMSIQQEQWKAEFDFNSKTQEQQYYANFVMSSIQAGNDPTDEMLSKAGLSRADANSMKAQVKSGGGGGSYNAKTDNGKDKKGLNLGDLDADAKNIWEGLNDTTETRERGKKLAQKINKG